MRRTVTSPSNNGSEGVPAIELSNKCRAMPRVGQVEAASARTKCYLLSSGPLPLFLPTALSEGLAAQCFGPPSRCAECPRESSAGSGVPSGLMLHRTLVPNAKALGYSRVSLRDDGDL